MCGTRSECTALALLAIFLLGAGSAETDKNLYKAAEPAIATFQNPLETPLHLPGCAPFVLERSLDSGWVNLGPPYLCVWEGIAVAVGMNERVDTPFNAPNDSGIYRLRYSYGSHCEADLPLSQANCQVQADVLSNEFEVERELCDPNEFGCRFRPAAPNFLCADGQHFGGPASECRRSPISGECGYEFLSCPATSQLGTAAVELLPSQPTEADQIAIRISGTWPDSCVPMNPNASINDQEIQIDTASFGGICLTVLTPWSETVAIGQLSADDYQLIVRNSIIPGPPAQIGQAVFTVPEPSSMLLQAAGASALTLLARRSRRTRRHNGQTTLPQSSP